MEKIALSKARSRFAEFVARAAGGERFVILHREGPLAAMVGVRDLERLERSAKIVRRLAQTLGQSKKLLDEIETGKVHPAMAAYGLWKNETDLAGLDDRVKKNRKRSSSRPANE